MNKLREVVERFLKRAHSLLDREALDEFVKEARDALAEPTPHPVAEVSHISGTGPNDVGIKWRGGLAQTGMLLYSGPTSAAAPPSNDLETSDAEIAQCMLSVDDPLLWGRLGEGSGDMVRKFARAVIAVDRPKRLWPFPDTGGGGLTICDMHDDESY